MKTPRQLVTAAIVPPMVIEVAWPRKAMPMKVAIACWRSFIGTRSPISASETGMVAAAKIPVTAR